MTGSERGALSLTAAARTCQLAAQHRLFECSPDRLRSLPGSACGYTVRLRSKLFRLGYLGPEFPRQTHIFFWRECEELRRREVEPVFLSTRRPPPAACPHAFRDQAAAATHYVFPPSVTGL